MIPAPKRLARALFLRLAPSSWSYDLGKLLTRTLLRPASSTCLADCSFAGGHTLRVDLANLAGNDLYCLGPHYESTTLRLWSRLAQESEVIVDIGSHVGLYAVTAAAGNPRARVIAVEPCPANLPLLRLNTAPFPNVTVVPCAVGCASGKGVLEERRISSGGVLIDRGAPRPAGEVSAGVRHTVRTMTLHELCTRHGLDRIDLMKLDVEGLEHSLLLGQQAFWDEFRPRHLIVEIGCVPGQRHRRQEIIAAMSARGYVARRCQSLQVIPWLRRGELSNWHFSLMDDGAVAVPRPARATTAAPLARSLAAPLTDSSGKGVIVSGGK